MSRRVEDPLTFSTLYSSPVVSVRDYCCRMGRGGPAAEECSANNDLVLMRRGAFAKHFGRQTFTADVNQAVFFSKGSTYRVSHPADCGDRGAVFTLAPQVLNDIVREIDPAIDDRPDRPFPCVTSPCDAQAFWRQHKLVERLKGAATSPIDPLWADATAIELAADVIQAALTRNGSPRRRRRPSTDAAHAE